MLELCYSKCWVSFCLILSVEESTRLCAQSRQWAVVLPDSRVGICQSVPVAGHSPCTSGECGGSRAACSVLSCIQKVVGQQGLCQKLQLEIAPFVLITTPFSKGGEAEGGMFHVTFRK